MVREMDLTKKFIGLSLACEMKPHNVMLGMLKLTSNVLEEIREGQK